MTIHYQGHGVTLHHGDCLDVLRSLPDCSVDSVVTDPPYGLEFMGKEWDKFAAPSKGRADLVEHSNFTAKKSKFKDGVGTQVGMPKKNPRCRACSRLKFDKPASKCACGAPDWDTRTREYAQDFQQWCEAWAAECLRVLKPGGHLLAFGGTRTWHRLACAVEDAGFEVRDSIAWMYGSGFPKSLDVSKAIDKRPGVTRHADFARHLAECREAAGLSRADVSEHVVGARTGACWNWEHHQFPEAKWWPSLRDLLDLDDDTWGPVIAEAEREVTGKHVASVVTGDSGMTVRGEGNERRDIPTTPDAERWQGWGTALKPAFEPVVVARKPLIGTVAATVLEHGTGALNIAACRIEHANEADLATSLSKNPGRSDAVTSGVYGADRPQQRVNTSGRWPANVVLDESQAEALDEQSGTLTSGANPTRRGTDKFREAYGDFKGQAECDPARGADAGGASRFFPTFRYEAKAPTSERVRVARNVLRLRADLTPAQVDHVRARLTEAGVQVD